MKKPLIVIASLVILVSAFGCGKATQTSSQSTFKANFSLNTVVENNKHFLLDEARYSSGAESGLPEPFLQSHEEMTVQINSSNVPEFLAAIRSDIEQTLIDSNVRILGSEDGSNDAEHFSFSYRENEIYGSIHVWGIPGGNSNFTLIVLITES
jgi:hypothetical protein